MNYKDLAELINNVGADTLVSSGFKPKQAEKPARAKKKENEDNEMVKFRKLTDQLAIVNPDASRWFHVPNGGQRNAIIGGKLKAMGTRKGVPDVLFLSPRSGYSFFVGEMKYGKNRTTDEQADWIAWFEAQGAYCCVCYSADEMFDLFSQYLDLAK